MVHKAVAWAADGDQERAEWWGGRLGIPAVPLFDLKGSGVDFALVARDGGIELDWLKKPEMSALRFEFESGPLRQRMRSLGKSNPLVKSLGDFKAGETIWDISFGQGLDSLLFLKLGMRVIAYERNPFIFALAEDGIGRARASNALNEFIDWDLIELRLGDALPEMNVRTAPEYIYFDPMFADKSKALPRKEMQFFSALVGNDADAFQVLERARKFAAKRTVVKRSNSADALSLGVTHAFTGKLVRYDMYLPSK